MKDKQVFMWLEKYLLSIGGWSLNNNDKITVYENAYFETYIKLTNGGQYYEYEIEICRDNSTQTFSVDTLLDNSKVMHSWAWTGLNEMGFTKEYLSNKIDILQEETINTYEKCKALIKRLNWYGVTNVKITEDSFGSNLWVKEQFIAEHTTINVIYKILFGMHNGIIAYRNSNSAFSTEVERWKD